MKEGNAPGGRLCAPQNRRLGAVALAIGGLAIAAVFVFRQAARSPMPISSSSDPNAREVDAPKELLPPRSSVAMNARDNTEQLEPASTTDPSGSKPDPRFVAFRSAVSDETRSSIGFYTGIRTKDYLIDPARVSELEEAVAQYVPELERAFTRVQEEAERIHQERRAAGRVQTLQIDESLPEASDGIFVRSSAVWDAAAEKGLLQVSVIRFNETDELNDRYRRYAALQEGLRVSIGTLMLKIQ